jgi:hypothetical protein
MSIIIIKGLFNKTFSLTQINHIRRRKERRDFYSSAFIMSDDEFHLRAVALQSAIEEDIANGKIPSL